MIMNNNRGQVISQNYLNTINYLESASKNLLEGASVEDFFDEKATAALKEEKDILGEIGEDFLKKIFGNESYELTSGKEDIEIWTKIFNPLARKIAPEREKREELSEQEWLQVIISSKEFAMAARSKHTLKKNLTFNNTPQLGAKDGNNNINNEEDRLKKTIENEWNFYFPDSQDFKGKDNGEKTLSQQRIAYNTEVINEIIKQAINGLMGKEDYYKDKPIKKIKNFRKPEQLIDYVNTTIYEIIKSEGNEELAKKLSKNNGEFTSWNGSFKITLRGEFEEGLFLQQRKTLKKNNEDYDSVRVFYESLWSFIKTNGLYKDDTNVQLNLGWLNTAYSLQGSSSAYDILEDDCKKKEDTLREKFSKLPVSEANVYGFLGEYLRVYESSKKVTLTGTSSDELNFDGKNYSLGQSFSDAYLGGETGKALRKIGLNIKHYVSSFSEDSVNLYDTKPISFGSSYMLRYIEGELWKKLRYFDYNYSFVEKKVQGKKGAFSNFELPDQKEKLQIYGNIMFSHISNFMRVSSAAEKGFKNNFFVINNVYIPVSYIWKQLVESGRAIIKPKKEDEPYFTFENPTGDPNKKRPRWLSCKNVKGGNRNYFSTVKFNGFTVSGNLMSKG